MDGHQLFDPILFLRGSSPVEQMFLGHGEHAAGAAGRVVDGQMFFRDGDGQQFHHQADHLPGGEMFPGLLTALFRESPQEFFVNITHLQVGELIGTKVEFLVLVKDGRQPVVLHHLADGGAVVEMFDDIVHILREPIDIGPEVFFEQGMVFFIDPAQRPVRFIEKGGLLRVLFQLLDQLFHFFFGTFRLFDAYLCLLFLPPI